MARPIKAIMHKMGAKINLFANALGEGMSAFRAIARRNQMGHVKLRSVPLLDDDLGGTKPWQWDQ